MAHVSEQKSPADWLQLSNVRSTIQDKIIDFSAAEVDILHPVI